MGYKKIEYKYQPDYDEPIGNVETLMTQMMEDGTTIFTPRHHKTDMRIEIKIAWKDYLRYKDADRDTWTEITDLTHNAQILVQSADCGADCYCDAIYKLKN